eukprot:scaffold7377_cov257-Pinguiococcus_pyrenoidosus.AAC.16
MMVHVVNYTHRIVLAIDEQGRHVKIGEIRVVSAEVALLIGVVAAQATHQLDRRDVPGGVQRRSGLGVSVPRQRIAQGSVQSSRGCNGGGQGVHERRLGRRSRQDVLVLVAVVIAAQNLDPNAHGERNSRQSSIVLDVVGWVEHHSTQQRGSQRSSEKLRQRLTAAIDQVAQRRARAAAEAQHGKRPIGVPSCDGPNDHVVDVIQMAVHGDPGHLQRLLVPSPVHHHHGKALRHQRSGHVLHGRRPRALKRAVVDQHHRRLPEAAILRQQGLLGLLPRKAPVEGDLLAVRQDEHLACVRRRRQVAQQVLDAHVAHQLVRRRREDRRPVRLAKAGAVGRQRAELGDVSSIS